MATAKNSIEEFTWMCNSLFGTYMDGIWGFKLVRDEAANAISTAADGKIPLMSFKPKVPDGRSKISVEEMNSTNVHMESADKIVKRNDLDGANSLILAQMALITVFHFWEDKYRAMIATEFDLPTPEDDKPIGSNLKVDGIGDIRLMRISIVHNKGIAKKEIERTKLFCWFKEGDYLSLIHI